MKEVKPYQDNTGSKKHQVAAMFDNISAKYDFLNHFLSLGIDKIWRKKAVKLLESAKPKYILDIATGTADFAIATSKLNPDKIIGVDISEGMLEVGRKKIISKSLDAIIQLQSGDSENLQFETDSFDACIVAFGVRNFENLTKGLQEMHRVLKENGTVLIIEFSKPKKFPMKQLYHFYFNTILPKIGSYVSKDRAAYTYLPESVKVFPDGNDFLNILQKTGFSNTVCHPLTLGIASIYVGIKKSS